MDTDTGRALSETGFHPSGHAACSVDGASRFNPSRIRDGKLYGCHVDLEEGEEPGGCVIEYGVHGDCAYGHFPSGRKRRTPFTCKWWRIVRDNDVNRNGEDPQGLSAEHDSAAIAQGNANR